MTPENQPKEPQGNFCGKMRKECKLLIAGTNAFICSHCVVDCLNLMGDYYYNFYSQVIYDEEF